MKHNSIFRRTLGALTALVLLFGMVMGQNNLSLSGNVTGNGTIKVKGNITNSANVSVAGTVQLKNTGAQSIGTSGTIDFARIVIPSGASGAKTFNVSSTISDTIGIWAGAVNTSSFVLGSNTLTLQGVINNTGGATSPYSFGSGTVDYDGADAQSVFGASGFTYGTLIVSNDGNKTMSGNIAVTTALTVSAGNLSINGNTLTVNGSYTNSDSITGSATSNLVMNGSGNIASFTLYGGLNNFTLNRSGNTVTMANNLAIAGAVTLTAGELAVSTNTLTLNGTGNVITGSGTLTSSTTGTVDYAQNAQNVFSANYGNLSFTAGNKTLPADTVGIAGTFTAGAGTHTVTGSTVDFNGAAQNIPAFTFNNFMTSGSGTKTATGNLTIGNNFDNGSSITLAMASFTLDTTSAGSINDNTGGTITFAGASNGLYFTTGTIEYNGTGGQAIAAGASYNNLVLSGSNGKTINSGVTVGTNSDLSVPVGVTLTLADATSALNLLGTSSLDVAGALSNAGTIDIGN